MISILERIWPPRKPRCDIKAGAREIMERERTLATLKMKREAAEANLASAFDDLLKVRETPRDNY